MYCNNCVSDSHRKLNRIRTTAKWREQEKFIECIRIRTNAVLLNQSGPNWFINITLFNKQNKLHWSSLSKLLLRWHKSVSQLVIKTLGCMDSGMGVQYRSIFFLLSSLDRLSALLPCWLSALLISDAPGRCIAISPRTARQRSPESPRVPFARWMTSSVSPVTQTLSHLQRERWVKHWPTV